MYCRNCGAPLAENAAVCPQCGAAVTPPASPADAQQPRQGQPPIYQPSYYNGYSQQPYQQQDRPNAGFNALAFFFPIVGLILYLVWKDQKPHCAHSIGKWALIGFIAGTVLTILGTVLVILLFSVVAPSGYEFGVYDNFDYGLSLLIPMLPH